MFFLANVERKKKKEINPKTVYEIRFEHTESKTLLITKEMVDCSRTHKSVKNPSVILSVELHVLKQQ